jgi:hypothetical protein
VRTRKHAQSIDLWSNTDLHTTWGADRALMATALNRITCAPCVQVHARGWCELLVCVRQTDDSRGRVSVVSVSVCSLRVRYRHRSRYRCRCRYRTGVGGGA